jgi:hypothetical protein
MTQQRTAETPRPAGHVVTLCTIRVPLVVPDTKAGRRRAVAMRCPSLSQKVLLNRRFGIKEAIRF